MTAIINNVIVQGKPEEIKELLDLQNKPKPDYQTYLGVDVEIICADCIRDKIFCPHLNGARDVGVCTIALERKIAMEKSK